MTSRASRKYWRKTRMVLIPISFLLVGIVGIFATSLLSRSNQTHKYTLPTDHRAVALLTFLRKLDGEYDPIATMLKTSNLSSINDAVRSTTKILDQDRSTLSPEESREANYYRLYYGLTEILSGGNRDDDEELDDLADRSRQYIENATKVATRESTIARYTLTTLDVSGRTSEAIEFADLIDDKFSRLPDSSRKSTVLSAITDIRLRLEMLNTEIDFSTHTLDGSPINIRDFRGKVVLIEFWSTTCVPCIADFPALKRIYQTYHYQGFEVLAVCLRASTARIKNFSNQHELPWIQISEDPIEGNEEWATQFGINAVPTTLLIDQSGKVISFGVRPLHPDDQLDLEKNLKKLLATQ